MIRALAALLLALAASACAPGYMKATDDAQAVLSRDGLPICSAFAVGPHDVMTAAHCVDVVAQYQITSREQWFKTSSGAADVQISYVDPDRDLALLRTDYLFRSYLTPREPVTGEWVTVVSAKAGWRESRGTVRPGFGLLRDTDVTIEHGWSGSPVIGTDGRAVGVVVRCYGSYINGRHVCRKNDMQFSVIP